MNKWTIGVFAALSVMAGSVLAQDSNAVRRATAEELLIVMKTPDMIAKTFESVKQMLPAQMKQMTGTVGQPLSPEATVQMQKMMDVMAEEFSWEKMKVDFITLYADTFTDDELKAIIAFYKTPAGQAFIAKQPELMKRSMEVSQRVMIRLMPKIKAMADEVKAKSPQAAPKTGAGPMR